MPPIGPDARQRWQVAGPEVHARLDAVIARRLGVSVHEARRIIDEGHVRVDGRPGVKGQRLVAEAWVELSAALAAEGGVPGGSRYAVLPQPELGLELVYEDDLLVALCKPAGWPTHPLKAGERGTVANALVARFPSCAAAAPDPREGGLVHRLDRDTSGVLLAARSPAAYLALRQAFSEHRVDKVYWALVHGQPRMDGLAERVIDVPLSSRGGLARVDAVGQGGLAAHTAVRLLCTGQEHALVEATARTGRMHQVRAHLAHLGHPLVGDTRYGAPRTEGLASDCAQLHALRITVPHPDDGRPLSCSAPLPAERRTLWERLLGRRLPESPP